MRFLLCKGESNLIIKMSPPDEIPASPDRLDFIFSPVADTAELLTIVLSTYCSS